MDISNYCGPDEWPRRWEAISTEIDKGIDWYQFRRNPILMRGIQCGSEEFKYWVMRCDSIGCPSSVYADSLFGNPIVELHNGVFASTTSARAAYYAWRIRSMWPNSVFNPSVVLEIGAGYGGLLRAIILAADIMPLHIALADAFPLQIIQRKFILEEFPDLQIKELESKDKYDLVINTNSLGEMCFTEVEKYFKIIQTQIKPQGMFFSYNRKNRVTNFIDYPYDDNWTHYKIDVLIHWIECFSIRNISIVENSVS